MSLVYHKNKRTGRTIVYESTPHYDPKTKQSRPKRKYLGMLDPETGELIPSSGRRGRRPGSRNRPKDGTPSSFAAEAAPSEPAGAGTGDDAGTAGLAAENEELRARVAELEARVGELAAACRAASRSLDAAAAGSD